MVAAENQHYFIKDSKKQILKKIFRKQTKMTHTLKQLPLSLTTKTTTLKQKLIRAIDARLCSKFAEDRCSLSPCQ